MKVKVKVVGVEAFPVERLDDVISVDPLAAGLLFGGDRWSCANRVAYVLNDQGNLIALATFSDVGEMYDNTPTLVGVWVHPRERKKGLGTSVALALIEDAAQRGMRTVRIDVISPGGSRLAQRLQRVAPPGVTLDVRDFHLPGGLLWGENGE